MTLIKRTELYRLVWSEPRRLLAPKYGVSDVGLGKTCRRHDIPKPPRGYWAKKAAGQKVEETPLPNPTPEVDIELHRETLVPDHPESDEPVDNFPWTRLQEEVDRRTAYEALPENRIELRATMRNLHPLVADARRKCAGIQLFGGSPNTPNSRPRSPIRATKATLDRTIRILDALCRTMELRGFELTSATSFRLFHAEVNFRIREKSTRLTVESPNGAKHFEFEPSGNFVIEVENGHSEVQAWGDSRKGSLDDRLNEVAAGLMIAAAGQHEWDAAIAVWEVDHRATTIEADIAENAATDLRRRRKQISNWARNWAKSKRIRRFILAAERSHRNGTLHWLGDLPFESWVTLAQEHADSLDPTVGELVE